MLSLKTIDEAGQVLFLEKPAEFNAVVLAWAKVPLEKNIIHQSLNLSNIFVSP